MSRTAMVTRIENKTVMVLERVFNAPREKGRIQIKFIQGACDHPIMLSA